MQWQNTCWNQLWGEKYYYGSWYLRFQFMFAWGLWWGQLSWLSGNGQRRKTDYLTETWKQRQNQGLESWCLLQGHTSNGLTASHWEPPSPGSTTSKQCLQLRKKSLIQEPGEPSRYTYSNILFLSISTLHWAGLHLQSARRLWDGCLQRASVFCGVLIFFSLQDEKTIQCILF